jgi:hypothetical protein
MRTIWKYDLIPNDENRILIEMPTGAKVLTVQVQGDSVCLWALVDTEMGKGTRIFEIYGTGHPVSTYQKRYIGTFQMEGGTLVFHVFERGFMERD